MISEMLKTVKILAQKFAKCYTCLASLSATLLNSILTKPDWFKVATLTRRGA